MNKKAVCLLSGGLDSSVCCFIAAQQDYDVYALTFRYTQRHIKEIDCATSIAQAVGAKKHVIFDIDFSLIGDSSLLTYSKGEITNHDLSDIGKSIPSTYVPGRNTVFLSLALSYAETVHADAIFIGVNAIDYSGYPDCRPEFIDAFQQMANLSSKCAVKGKQIWIKAPLLYCKKSEIIRRGIELNVPFEYTWSCYKGLEKACGCCDSCQLRLKGFIDAGHTDPLSYEKYPSWYSTFNSKK
ncbi:MAG: 7-cyano-7-deazaguanine synthase QueC [Thermoplasmatota archaeon]